MFQQVAHDVLNQTEKNKLNALTPTSTGGGAYAGG